MLKESIQMSWENIIHNKLRSFLTVLGIVIGVTAIIALVTIVQGVSDEMTSQFAQLGAGKLSISAQGTALKQGLNADDLAALQAIDGVEGVSPTVNVSASAVRGGKLSDSISVEGRSPEYFRNQKDLLERGRATNPLDVAQQTRVCVIDHDLEQLLFYGTDPLGQTLQINGKTFTVVGVLSDNTKDVLASMNQLMGGASDGKVIVPYTTAMRMSGANSITSLDVMVTDPTQTDQVEDAVRAALNRAFNYKDDSYNLINMEGLLDTMNQITGMMATMLGGIASIALLVGGIGIMNMMLVSVTERTPEIGLRKALGAEPKRIQIQFLLESIFLSLMGGVLGAVLGVIISAIGCTAIGIDITISWPAIGLGVGFSAVVGILFGWAPARKASRLNPIDALRSM